MEQITFDQAVDPNFKPNTVPVHQLHTENTFFSKEDLENDPEARELEEQVFAHGRAPKYEFHSSQFDQPFQQVDDFGKPIPSMHAISTFNEFGVNEEGQTISQVLEQEREAKAEFDDYAKRYMELQVEMEHLKADLKQLDVDFKDKGLQVALFKKAIKWRIQLEKKTEEERWADGVMRHWALGSRVLTESVNALEVAKEATKEIGRDKEERQRKVLSSMKEKYDARYAEDAKTGRGAIDNDIEKQAVFASFGAPGAEEEFIKLEESKKIRDARRAKGFKDLAMHSNELQPANRAQFKDVFNDEFHARREEFERQKREDEIFDPSLKESQWHLDYEPTDVPVEYDYKEVAKHGINQAKKMQNCAYEIKEFRKGHITLPEANWVDKFVDLTDAQLDQLIMTGAKAEDYLDNKLVCDQVYLPGSDERRMDYDSDAMRIARWNRLVRTGRLDGEIIEYDPIKEFAQAKDLPPEL